MIIVTIQDDGRAVIPKSALERLGVRPGDKLELNAVGENGAATLHLHIAPKEAESEAPEAEAMQENGVWVIRTRPLTLDETMTDWVALDRETRMNAVTGKW